MTYLPERPPAARLIAERASVRCVEGLDPYRTDLEFGRLGDRIVSGAGQNVHGDFGETEAGEDGAARGLRR